MTLSTVWREHPTVLFFLRHLGCTFCRKQVADMQQHHQEIRDLGGELLAITLSPPAETAAFRERLKLSYACLCDPEKQVYAAYGLERGGVSQVAGPAVWWKGLLAVLQYGVGMPRGDTLQLQGTFVIDRGGTVRLAHRGENSADLPAAERVVAAVRQAASPGRVSPPPG